MPPDYCHMADHVGIFCDNTTDVDDSGAGNCMFGVTAAVERMEYTSSCKTHGIHRMYIYIHVVVVVV